jgi:hypothetical protein
MYPQCVLTRRGGILFYNTFCTPFFPMIRNVSVHLINRVSEYDSEVLDVISNFALVIADETRTG